MGRRLPIFLVLALVTPAFQSASEKKNESILVDVQLNGEFFSTARPMTMPKLPAAPKSQGSPSVPLPQPKLSAVQIPLKFQFQGEHKLNAVKLKVLVPGELKNGAKQNLSAADTRMLLHDVFATLKDSVNKGNSVQEVEGPLEVTVQSVNSTRATLAVKGTLKISATINATKFTITVAVTGNATVDTAAQRFITLSIKGTQVSLTPVGGAGSSPKGSGSFSLQEKNQP